MLPKVLGFMCVALTALTLYVFESKQNTSIAQDNRFEVPAIQSSSQEVQEVRALAHQAVEQLDAQLKQLVETVNQGEADRQAAIDNLSSNVTQMLEEVKQNTLSREDVVKLVNATVDEKTSAVKAEFGEACKCDCDCDTKLAEVTKQLEELKNRVATMEAAQIKPGMTNQAVVERLQAMGYTGSRAGSSAQVTTTTQPMADNRPGHWTHPGDIASHLATDHAQELQALGVSTIGMTEEQMKTVHDALHEGTFMPSIAPSTPMQPASTFQSTRTRTRSNSRVSACPPGGCPNRRASWINW